MFIVIGIIENNHIKQYKMLAWVTLFILATKNVKMALMLGFLEVEVFDEDYSTCYIKHNHGLKLIQNEFSHNN